MSKHIEKIGVIAKNTEDYISFSIKVEVDKYIDKDGKERPKEIELRFIDSIKFMSSSLDSLVNNLAKGNHQFFLGLSPIATINANCSFEKESTHMSTWIVGIDLKKPVCLPLNISIAILTCLELAILKDYEHACSIWRDFGIRNLGEYHDLYLRTNVMLVANVLESFRCVCLDNYGLDPAHFYTAPGLAWKACPKENGYKIRSTTGPRYATDVRARDKRRNYPISSQIGLCQQSIYGSRI